MKIGNVEIKNNLVLAPMAGVTDVAFRTLCSRFGAGLTTTEMVSVKGLYYGDKKTEDFLKTNKCEKPVAVQLFGSDPEIFAEVVKMPQIQKFDIIDINMGCPAPKIVKNGEGSALMKNFDKACEIIKACCKSTTKPITVKFRKGFDHDVCVEFAKMCEEAGASAITIHGRLAKQMYSGEVDIECIKRVKQAVNIPVFANGDVCDRKSFEKMLVQTGCDGVMIGRATWGAPWIFKEILENKTVKNKLSVIKKHIKIAKKFGVLNLLELRKHFAWYIKDFPGSALIRNEIFMEKNEKEIIKILNKIKTHN